MGSEVPHLGLIESLSEIPFHYNDRNAALKRIAELGHEVMGSLACTLVFVDLAHKKMTQLACVSSNKEFEHYMTDLEFSLGRGRFVDLELISEGKVIEKTNLQEEGNGVANPEIARRFGLGAILGIPLSSNGKLLGYINTISVEARPFTAPEKRLMEILARQAVLTMENFDFKKGTERATEILNKLSQDLLSGSNTDFLQAVCDNACELLRVPVCMVWQRSKSQNGFSITTATKTVDDEYRKLALELNDPRVKAHLSRKAVSYLSNVGSARRSYVFPDAALDRGWVSLLSAPMWADDELVGILDIYTKEPRQFASWEKHLLGYFANQAAICIQKNRLLKREEFGKKVETLLGVMVEMAEATDPKNVWELLLKGGLDLVGADRGWIRQFNYQTGLLEVVAQHGNPKNTRPSRKIGEGITGWAFVQEKPVLANNVKDERWKDIYIDYMEDTQSELAIPILVRQAQVRVKRQVEFGTKPLGVLNIESSALNAFTETDQNWLWSLACYAAIVIDNLEYDKKLNRLRRIGELVAKEREPDTIIQTVLKAIEEALGFEHINVSVIVPERGIIKSEHIVGMTERLREEFKRDVVHKLTSDDILADIIKTRNIEVPDNDDKRFHPKIFSKYEHHKLNRVFFPMIVSSTNRVIGTVDAGYKKEYRKYIYERDVQILISLVDYITQAIEQEMAGLLLDQVTHEVRSPIVGIRGHADVLRMGWGRFTPDIIDAKFEDILADCAILLYQFGLLEYKLGGKRQQTKPKSTNVFRDIIIKTINSVVKPILRRKNIPFNKVEYNPGDSSKIIMVVDSVKLNQVVYNLLTNSIKYAKKNPKDFKLRIEVDASTVRGAYLIKFMDWGIGIEEGYEEKIFEEGVRTPEAIKMDVNGSGFGLTIARRIMHELGGDLKLVNNQEPTEFNIVLPKIHLGGKQ